MGDLLAKRGFPADVQLVAIHDIAEACLFASRISGIYYQMPTPVAGRPSYQKLLYAPATGAGIACDGVYILWSAAESQWQICTGLSEEAPCVAYCKQDREQLAEVLGPWQVQQKGSGDFQED